MARPRKEYESLSCRLAKDASDKLGEICIITGQTKTTAIERAIMLYYDEVVSTEPKITYGWDGNTRK